MGSPPGCGEPVLPQLRMPPFIMFKALAGLKCGFDLYLQDGMKIITFLEGFPLIGSVTGTSANHPSELSISGFWSVRRQYRKLPGFISGMYASLSRIFSIYGESTMYTLLDNDQLLNNGSH